MARHKPHVALDCYVRASATSTPVDDFLDAVQQYADTGLVDEFSVDVWPDRTRLRDDGTPSATVLDDYERFRSWADNDGVSLEPAFERRTRTTLVGDDPETFLLLPVVCLAVRIDGDLVTVAPHTTGTTAYTVADALSDVESLLRNLDAGSNRELDDLPSNHAALDAVESASIDEGDGETGVGMSATDADERSATNR